MTDETVHEVIEAFVSAAERAEAVGFHGVELHGAHGYLICRFYHLKRIDETMVGAAVSSADRGS